MKYWYIVWREDFKSTYSREQQGNGYYGGWKNKCEDYWTRTPLEANKFKTLKGAINRLRLDTLNDKILSMNDFWKFNPPSKSFLRDKNINQIIGGEEDLSQIFEKGRVERIYEDGKIECANKEVIEFIENLVKDNLEKREKFRKKHHYILEPTKNIVEHDPNEDFWEGF